jgi:hypothetical protein
MSVAGAFSIDTWVPAFAGMTVDLNEKEQKMVGVTGIEPVTPPM